MNSSQFQLVMDIFKRATELPESERPEFVRERCGGDAEAKDRILAMLGVDGSDFRTAAGLQQLAANLPENVEKPAEVPLLSGQHTFQISNSPDNRDRSRNQAGRQWPFGGPGAMRLPKEGNRQTGLCSVGEPGGYSSDGKAESGMTR